MNADLRQERLEGHVHLAWCAVDVRCLAVIAEPGDALSPVWPNKIPLLTIGLGPLLKVRPPGHQCIKLVDSL